MNGRQIFAAHRVHCCIHNLAHGCHTTMLNIQCVMVDSTHSEVNVHFLYDINPYAFSLVHLYHLYGILRIAVQAFHQNLCSSKYEQQHHHLQQQHQH